MLRMDALISEHCNYDHGTGEWISTFRHTESIKDLMHNITKEDFPTLIRLASLSLASMRKEATDIQYKETLDRDVEEQTQRIRKKGQEEMDRVLLEKQQELIRLKTTITELTVQREAQARNEAEYRESLRIVQEGTQLTHRKEIDRLHAYTQSLQAQILQAQEKSHQGFQGSLQAIEERYGKEVERVREDMRVRVSELQGLLAKSEDSRKVGSRDIGHKGEREFEELVAEYTHWGPLEDTSKQPHSADWRCTVRKCKILFEVKNYASDVPKAQVTKFERDMALHADAPLGIFLSLKSRLQGNKYNDFITIEWSPASQMMIYINCLNSQDMKSVFAFLDVCIDIAFRTYHLAQTHNESEESVRLQEKLIKIKALLGHELLRIAEWMKDAKSETKAVTDLLLKQGVVTQEKINTSRSTLLSILGLLDGHDTEEVVEVSKKKTKHSPKQVVS